MVFNVILLLYQYVKHTLKLGLRHKTVLQTQPTVKHQPPKKINKIVSGRLCTQPLLILLDTFYKRTLTNTAFWSFHWSVFRGLKDPLIESELHI